MFSFRQSRLSRKAQRNTQARKLLFESMESRRLLASSQSSLVDRIEQHFDNAPGITGAAVVNLTTGEEALINADFEFSTSSTIKAGILYALMRRIDADPAVTTNTIVNSGGAYGSNQGSTLQPNTNYTVIQLANTMIANSNNWATNRLIDFLTFDSINEEFANLGLNVTFLDRYMMGGPSNHGTSGPGGDYQLGFDNVSTAREFVDLLQQIHENDGLLTGGSYATYWNIMGQDSNLGANTKGDTDNYYNASVLGNWSDYIDRANKPGSNTWNGSAGDFTFDPELGTHRHRSEAGRLIMSNTGEVVFYTVFVNYATSGDLSVPISQLGYEVAAEFAEAPATYTPAAAQLDDGRRVTVRGTAGDDDIDITDTPNDVDNFDITINGDFIASIDPEDDFGVDLVDSVYVYARAGDDNVSIDAFAIPLSTVVFGEAGDDTLSVGSAATLSGGADNDTLLGSDENDFLTGDSGNDSLSGRDGDDILAGGIGNDSLSGGEGNDILTGLTGNDSLSGSAGDDVLNGGSGNDTLNGGDDEDTLYGDIGDDTLNGGAANDELFGGSGEDTLNGNGGEDELRGEAGDDDLVGGADSDTLFGGDDNDQLIGGYQTHLVGFAWDQSGDLLDGGAGDDTLLGDNGQLLPLALGQTGGNDTLRGGLGNDLIFGQGGNDHIQGNAGDDNIYAGAGNDTVFGGTYLPIVGPPVFLADGSDFVEAGDGNDLVYGDNWQVGTPPVISFGGAADTLRGGAGNDVIYGQTGDDELSGNTDDDVLLGGVGNDIVDGNSGDDTLHGFDGHDRLVGGEGSDELFGHAGNDVLVGGRFSPSPNNAPDASDDLLEGGDGHDLLFGDSAYLPLALDTNTGGNDTLRGGNDNDILYGQRGDDLLEGGNGNDSLIGGEEDDELHGGSGNDVVRGGWGDDLIVGGSGVDTLYGDEHNDRLVGGNLLAAQWDASADTLDGGSGDDLLRGDSGPADASNAVTIFGGNDLLIGNLGNDTLLGQAGNDTIEGGLGNDIAEGSSGNDFIRGGGDDDILSGGGGNDIVAGETGNDIVDGDQGDDVLLGGTYFVVGNAVADLGNDVVRGGIGNDWVFGDSWSQAQPLNFGVAGGNDTLEGGDGDDLVIGQAGNDLIRGGAGNDVLSGRQGNDIVLGDAGDDELYGDAGRDILIGGLGADQLAGGNDDDLLIAGSTTFDANDAALQAIAAEWSSPRTYAERVANLRGRRGPEFANRLNGDHFLTSRTVLNDNAADTLSGNAGLDWFFSDPLLDSVTDAAPGEALN